jgi:hypothetical protein
MGTLGRPTPTVAALFMTPRRAATAAEPLLSMRDPLPTSLSIRMPASGGGEGAVYGSSVKHSSVVVQATPTKPESSRWIFGLSAWS